MILDAQNELSNQQAVTSTAISANVIDLAPLGPNASRDIGAGEPLYLLTTVNETVTAAGSATVAISLESADNEALSSNPVVHYTTGPIGKAALTAGTQFRIAIPRGDYKRYLGLRYTVATGPLTAGKFSGHLILGIQDNKHYGVASTIS